MRTLPRRLLAGAALALLGLGVACSYPRLDAWRGEAPPVEARPVVAKVPIPPSADPEIAGLDALPLLRLCGDGYARGHAYGRAMADAWRQTTEALEWQGVDLVREYVPPKFLAKFLVRQFAAHVVHQFARRDDPRADEFFPPEYRAYVRGIADGAGIDVARVERMMAFVMLSDASCSAFAAFGPATDDGRLLQMRNLDWGDDDLPIGQNAVLIVHEPPGGLRYLSMGFVGLVGSISGINEAGISLSEIGAGTNDSTWRGLPMPLLMERVLAEASTLDEAVRIFREAPGTGGYNFIVGSARERRAVVIEKTARLTAVFEVGAANYRDNPFFEAFAGFDCRASTAADPRVRAVQDCTRADDGTPRGTNAYESRYRRQVELFEQWGHKIDLERAWRLADEVAPGSNVQSVVYDFERRRVYVRNRAWFRDGRTDLSDAERKRIRAAAQPAAVIDLDRLFP